MYRQVICAAALAIVVATSPVSADAVLTSGEKAMLQAAMHRAIDRNLVNGAYLHFDVKKRDVQALHPARAHPMILSMGEHFILCTDFRDSTGKTVNVDFYVARSRTSFTVFHTEIDNRKPIEELMAVGRVAMVK